MVFGVREASIKKKGGKRETRILVPTHGWVSLRCFEAVREDRALPPPRPPLLAFGGRVHVVVVARAPGSARGACKRRGSRDGPGEAGRPSGATGGSGATPESAADPRVGLPHRRAVGRRPGVAPELPEPERDARYPSASPSSTASWTTRPRRDLHGADAAPARTHGDPLLAARPRAAVRGRDAPLRRARPRQRAAGVGPPRGARGLPRRRRLGQRRRPVVDELAGEARRHPRPRLLRAREHAARPRVARAVRDAPRPGRPTRPEQARELHDRPQRRRLISIPSVLEPEKAYDLAATKRGSQT